jgi:hypothetical protein
MKIEISDKHADVICKACDVLSRLHMGQMSIVLQEMFWKTEPEERELVATAFKAIVPTTHGIFGDVPQDAKVAWDIQQVIRQDLAIRRNGGKRNPMQVQFDDPMQSSKEPLPKITGQADQDLLETQLADANRLNEKLRHALQGLRVDRNGCFCDAQFAMGGAHPHHSPECEEAMDALGITKGGAE